MSSSKTQHTKKRLVEAMEKSLGVVTTACKIAKVDRATYYRIYHRDKKFKEAVDDIQNVALDFAESQLHKQIREGNTTATIFYLKTKGKKRGYVERQELTGKEGQAIQFIVPSLADDLKDDEII